MNKFILGFITFIILLALVVVFISLKGELFAKKAIATFGKQKVTLEIADSLEEQEKGLSGRKFLAENRGMIFVFERPGIQSFWMRGMNFPLDIIFLRGNKIVTIYKNVPAPASKDEIPSAYYQPTSPSDKVIELNAGMADKFDLNVGDTITLTL